MDYRLTLTLSPELLGAVDLGKYPGSNWLGRVEANFVQLQWPLFPHRKHMSVGLGIRRPIKEKQSGTKQETKTTIYNRLDNIYIYRYKTNVFCQCSASRDVLLSRLPIFIVSYKCAVAICINDYTLRSHPKENSNILTWIINPNILIITKS
jgi:hypothetical protein